jgi:hypothetical protein
VLADMARKQEEYAKQVAQAGGIALCVKLLAKGSLEAQVGLRLIARLMTLDCH